MSDVYAEPATAGEPTDPATLAHYTTLRLGGPAGRLEIAEDAAQIVRKVQEAEAREQAVLVLAGGSNVVIGDQGFPGTVVLVRSRGFQAVAENGDTVTVRVQAGEPWDDFVAATVERGWSGLECLSGIPGSAGATPIQNVGAYGQEVGETLRSVRVLDREAMTVRELDVSECELAYRDSALKRHPDRYAVLAVTFALIPDGAPAIRYAELERALAVTQTDPADRGLATVRETVIELRRKKSMVIDPDDPNRRSAGSFFTNPIVERELAEALVQRAVREGLVSSTDQVPRWPAGERVKLAAGWLIERSGIEKGLRHGRVGVSTKHALALVHHGGGTTAELLELAETIRRAVHARFGIELTLEPVRWS